MFGLFQSNPRHHWVAKGKQVPPPPAEEFRRIGQPFILKIPCVQTAVDSCVVKRASSNGRRFLAMTRICGACRDCIVKTKATTQK